MCSSSNLSISKYLFSLNSRLIFASNSFSDFILDIHYVEVVFIAVKDCTE